MCAAARAGGSSSEDMQGLRSQGHLKAGTAQPGQTCGTVPPPQVPANETNELLKLWMVVRVTWTGG